MNSFVTSQEKKAEKQRQANLPRPDRCAEALALKTLFTDASAFAMDFADASKSTPPPISVTGSPNPAMFCTSFPAWPVSPTIRFLR